MGKTFAEIAVLSDIHSNYVALETCVDFAIRRGINTFVFLGDYLGELAYPQKTMSILYELNAKYQCYFVKGNKEEYWLNYEKCGETGWKEIDSTTGALYYTYYHLTWKDMDFYKGLSHKGELHFENLPSVTICHGSPNRVNEKMLPDSASTFTVMENDPNPYILCGHTHEQGKIEHNGKVVFNSGAVGTSLNAGGKARFMILTGEEDAWNAEFVCLDYDVEKVIAELHSSGLSEKAPCWSVVTEKILRTGEVSHGAVLARAMELCRKDTGGCIWPEIPEKYWEQAVREMIGR